MKVHLTILYGPYLHGGMGSVRLSWYHQGISLIITTYLMSYIFPILWQDHFSQWFGGLSWMFVYPDCAVTNLLPWKLLPRLPPFPFLLTDLLQGNKRKYTTHFWGIYARVLMIHFQSSLKLFIRYSIVYSWK